MTDSARPTPRQAAPKLSLPLAGGGTFDLAETAAENFTLLFFYRGLHCPICKRQLGALQAKLDEFAALGVSVVALSMDSKERAERAKAEWEVPNLPIAYGLSGDQAHEWGLFFSGGIGTTSTGIEEPTCFSEPGLFVVRPDGTLFASSVQSMPFTRPPLAELLGGLKYIIENEYPARGELPGCG